MNDREWGPGNPVWEDLKEERRARGELGKIDRIRALVDLGVLGSEYCPKPEYWHWPILKEEELPEEFKTHNEVWGEIRWYGEM